LVVIPARSLSLKIDVIDLEIVAFVLDQVQFYSRMINPASITHRIVL